MTACASGPFLHLHHCRRYITSLCSTTRPPRLLKISERYAFDVFLKYLNHGSDIGVVIAVAVEPPLFLFFVAAADGFLKQPRVNKLLGQFYKIKREEQNMVPSTSNTANFFSVFARAAIATVYQQILVPKVGHPMSNFGG